MLEIAFGKATITRNAQRVGFGKPAVSPQCSECYRCPTTSRFLQMFTSFSHTTPRAPFTTKLFRNSAHGSGSMPPTLLYGNFWSDCETRSANRHFTTSLAVHLSISWVHPSASKARPTHTTCGIG